MSKYEPSKYQKAIFEFVKNGNGHAVVQAVAGSGKTTTIVEATKYIPANENSIFLAFGKDIADELRPKLPRNIECRTTHSFGMSMFSYNGIKARTDFNKQGTLCYEAVKKKFDFVRDKELFREHLTMLNNLIPKIKSTLTDYTDAYAVEEMANQFGYDYNITPVFMQMLVSVVDKMKDKDQGIDFNDMLWIPVITNMDCKKYDWIFVDECQDLNKAQAELIKRMCDDNTRVIFVGDTYQSIYAFRGADVHSMDNLQKHFNAKELPLSICYRCGKEQVKLAQKIVPHIEANDTAPEGIVQELEYDEVVDKAEEGDKVICRTNAPLVKLAFEFIKHDKKAVVLGQDIGMKLKKQLEEYQQGNVIDTISKIDEKIQKLNEKYYRYENDDTKTKQLKQIVSERDSLETLIVILDNVDTIQQAKNKLFTIFSKEAKGITLSTVHKAKGLEADRVFILGYDMMPHPMAKTDEDIQQEYNIKYVAITRSKKELYLIDMKR
jgi:DNA helicase-2/ATP-dependent DNA helicase PcrA